MSAADAAPPPHPHPLLQTLPSQALSYQKPLGPRKPGTRDGADISIHARVFNKEQLLRAEPQKTLFSTH